MPLTAEGKTVLLRARVLIETGQEQFVCHAIMHAAEYDGDPEMLRAADRLHSYVMKHNSTATPTLSSWQYENGVGSGSRLMTGAERQDGMRAERVQWITWMLGEDA